MKCDPGAGIRQTNWWLDPVVLTDADELIKEVQIRVVLGS